MLGWDYQLFEWINQHGTHSLLDHILPFLREKNNWIPLYVFFILFAIIKMKAKSWIWVVCIIAAVGMTDAVGNYGFKKTIERPRPCHTESPVEARLLVNCGSGYSFTSNHAANHMCLAVFLSGTLFLGLRWVNYLLLFWALSIGYAQIYVGVHYPLDVAAGWLLGSITGSIWILIYRRVNKGGRLIGKAPKT